MDSATFKANATANIVDYDPTEVLGEEPQDFCFGTDSDGNPIIHAPQIVTE